MGSYQSKKNRSDMSNNNGTEEQSFASTVAKKKQEEKESTKKLAKTAGKGAATYFGGPAGGQAVDMAANTKQGDKILNKGGEALGKVPGVKKAAKKLDDEGLIDKADQAIGLAGGSIGGGAGNGMNTEGAAAKGATPKTNTGTNGGSSSTPGGDSSSSLSSKKGGLLDRFRNREKSTGTDDSNKEEEKDDKDKKGKSFLDGKFKVPTSIKLAIISLVPLLLIIILIIAVIASYISMISHFLDFLGISTEIGFSTGGVEYVEGSDKAQAFYKRVSEVKEEYARNNKNVDAILITSVYHVMNYHNNKYDYEK